MSKSIECEPYLADDMSVFHTIFIPFDKSLNTSEIKPLHLSLPRNRQGIRTTNASNQSGQTQSSSRLSNNVNNQVTNETNSTITNTNPINNTNNANNAGEKKGTRFLSNHYLSQNDSSKNAKNTSSASKESSTPYKGINEVAQKILPQPQSKNTESNDISSTNAQISAQSSKPKQLTVTNQNDREVVDMLMKNDDYWYLPLLPSIIIRLIFVVSSSSPKYNFNLFVDGEKTPLMSAEMLGSSRADGVAIYINKKQIGETYYTAGNSSLFAGISIIEDQKDEACAAIYNPSFSSASQPRIFDFLVPALKKINGRSRMLPIQLDESSGLVARLSQMSKEAIRLKTRIPATQGNSFDMTFDGRFQQPSLSNFILYHDSNTRKDLCTLGMISSGHYLLSISYPLSPIQGFLAAISASVPI